ncbi:Plancitoxin-1, partial [Trichinella britovi]
MKRLTREFTNSSLIQYRVVIYKAPARNIGKALIAGVNANAWQNTQDLTGPNNHAVAKSLEHVIEANPGNKFIAYNNIPPDVPKVKTKSNSKGVLMMNPNNVDEASWIVHTIPGFPKALTGYVFPPAEIQKGHLFICLTIKKSEIDAIAMALRIATPLIYHNDIPDDPARPNLKKLVNGESRLTPPLTVAQQISTAAAQGLKMTIYSKSEKSKYAPTQNRGKALIAGAAGAWQDTVAVTGENGHSFAKALEHVIAADATNKFIAYNNIPPDVPKVNTKSNSKGLLMMNPRDADEASWIVHTVPGFPKALRGYVFPPAEIQKGHLLICLTIKESEIDAIAMALRIATPLIYHNDIPDAEIDSRPNLKKLANAASRLTPPLTVTRDISTAAPGGLKVTIYSKGEKSKYEIYRRVLVKKLKTSIKVWTTRDKILKSDCRILNRNIKLVTSPITIGDHASSLETPARNIGKALIAGGNANAWQNTPVLTQDNNHAVVKSLEHVIRADAGNKFIAYNNIPPNIPKVKTKSNSKGVLMMNPQVADEASWIVHTIPGFPKALTGY